jgi:hypothetical protein
MHLYGKENDLDIIIDMEVFNISAVEPGVFVAVLEALTLSLL